MAAFFLSPFLLNVNRPRLPKIETYMKPTVKKKALFVAFLALFVVFGGGRAGDWVIVCRDQDGWTYEVDLQSLRVEDGRYDFQVLVERDGQSQHGRWTIVRNGPTLQIEDGQIERILPGSVASRILRFLESSTEAGDGKKVRPGG